MVIGCRLRLAIRFLCPNWGFRHVYFQSPNYAPGQNTFGHPSDTWDEALWHGPPCCTGNQARMLPNYIHHMWFGTADGGLAATMYGPTTVTTVVGTAGNRRNITIASDTTYPFARENAVRYTVSLDGGVGRGARGKAAAAGSVRFPLLLRVPGWTTVAEMRLSVNGAVRQLRHHFGPFSAHISAICHPAHAVVYVPLGAHADRRLIGDWNPML